MDSTIGHTYESPQRRRQLDALDGGHFDAFVIGGGINGAVSAAALTAQGHRVAIVDRGDFAGFTSQESSNLVWGGFKYLQTYEFKLVRKLSQARNKLIKSFPSSIQPIDFLAVFDDQAPFPSWLASMGSFAYWAIGDFDGRPPRPMSTASVRSLEPVVDTESVTGGLRYADAYLPDNDARFVFGFVRSALEMGATTANYVEVGAVERTGDRWQLELRDVVSDATFAASADTIINATGPFLDGLNERLANPTQHRIALSKGIHLVVPRVGTGERVLAFFDEQERLYYVIPMGTRSVIGTTDTKTTDPNSEVTDADREFVLRQVNSRLIDSVELTTDDIIAERSGVRPLVVKADDNEPGEGDWLELSRRHEIEVDTSRNVISIFGGKLTDCLNVGEEVAEATRRCATPSSGESHTQWYGESGTAERDAFLRQMQGLGIDSAYAQLLWRRYDKRAPGVVESFGGAPDMITPAGGALDAPYSTQELQWVGENELVVSSEDFLRRRSNLALTTSASVLASANEQIDSALRHSVRTSH